MKFSEILIAHWRMVLQSLRNKRAPTDPPSKLERELAEKLGGDE
jgi:hypothetical protein